MIEIKVTRDVEFSADKVYGAVADFGNVVHAADVGVRDLPGQPDLAQKTVQAPRVVLQALRQKFQRDRTVELSIDCLINDTHTALAELAGQAVLGQHGV